MKYYIHIQGKAADCVSVDIEQQTTLQELATLIANQYGVEDTSVQFQTAWKFAKPIPNQSMFVSSFYDDKSDVFVAIKAKTQDIVKATPIRVEDVKEEYYTPITKYTFYELDDMNVRVILDLKGVGSLPQENFSSRFLERSFQLKIRNYTGKNFMFGVGRLHNRIDPNGCKFVVKPEKILITLRKFKKEDNWFTLFKTRTIGGTDSD